MQNLLNGAWEILKFSVSIRELYINQDMEIAFYQEAALSCTATGYPDTFTFYLCFPMYSVNSSVWLCIFGIKMCSWATFRPLGYRQRAQYKNNKLWSHLYKQWDWKFFMAVCSKNFVAVTIACQGRVWADVISQLVPVSLGSKPRQMEITGLQGFPHLSGSQDLEVLQNAPSLQWRWSQREVIQMCFSTFFL